MSLIESISTVYKRISHAAMRAGREPSEISLVAVTKTVPSGMIKDAIDAGVRLFGENRVQEAQKKISNLKPEISNSEIEWHMIGHLQSNKARLAVGLFDMIQSVDSLDLAERIDRYARESGKVQRVLIQVNLSGEESKSGVSPGRLFPLLEAMEMLKNLEVKGLMTIPPFFDKPEDVRPYFRRLRELRDEGEEIGFRLPELSMGMSHDFETAIEEGATIVRIGTAIFGERNKRC